MISARPARMARAFFIMIHLFDVSFFFYIAFLQFFRLSYLNFAIFKDFQRLDKYNPSRELFSGQCYRLFMVRSRTDFKIDFHFLATNK